MSEATQTQFPFRAVLRTAVAYVLGLLTTWLISTLPGVGEVFVDYSEALTDIITNVLAVFFGGLYTWLMSRPRINDKLSVVGLSAQPKRALTED